MLHPVTGRIREVVGEKCVSTRLEFGELPVNRFFLLHDLRDIPDERLQFRGRPGVMRGEAERPRTDREGFDRHWAELDRTVDQILQVGSGELGRGRTGLELCRDLPLDAGRGVERQRRRSIVVAARPHDCRWHVDVRMGGIDGQVGAVNTVAVDLVLDGDRGRVLGNTPPGVVGMLDAKLASIGSVGMDVVDVLREVVKRIPPWRRSTDAEVERSGAHAGKRGFDLHPLARRLGEAESIAERFRGVGERRTADK